MSEYIHTLKNWIQKSIQKLIEESIQKPECLEPCLIDYPFETTEYKLDSKIKFQIFFLMSSRRV